MSFASFFAGLSGLQSNSSRLSIIGNNLANINTIGFKSGRATFQDIFSSAGGVSFNGAGNPMQIGRGVEFSGIDQIFSQGSFQSTPLLTDIAIQGKGFFVMSNAAGSPSYTRAGNFTFNEQGRLVNPEGFFVQGFTTRDANGLIRPSGAVTDIVIPSGLSTAPEATNTLAMFANLNAGARVGTATVDAEEFVTTLSVFDSIGGRHNVTLTFTPIDTNADGALDEWSYDATVPGAEVTGGTAGTPFSIGSGTMVFDQAGQLTLPASDIALAVPGWANGSAAQSIAWELFDDAGASIISGWEGTSAVSSVTQDGFALGILRTLVIDGDGLISGIFTNGITQELARIAVASFNNASGLIREGSNVFVETNASGPATIGAANTGGRGGTISNTLELSNVDITKQFTNMIITQRGYQANSRIITTTDEVIQEALNLKR